ncbi:MAG: hypothetical protein H0T89_27845 [Deltaproteobacteria bacterium]|nr:hypothetical protein [Deltaproteobacteria bacterium]MDQ3298598.1 hypothetical protein [Myxococcota bacterium]
MRLTVVALLVAMIALAAARGARHLATTGDREQSLDVPYAPSPAAAPIVTLGYRELAADLLFVRLIGYFGSEQNTAQGLAAIAEAIATLDPHFRRVYEVGALAMSAARTGVDQSIHLRAIALLEAGGRAYPAHWKFPSLAGQIYLVDLQTEDPVQRRAWDEKGTRLLEAAARKPNAPAVDALTASFLQTKLGQHERAVNGLRELLLITNDHAARQRILDQLAKLSEQSTDAIATELLIARLRFERRWKLERPAVPPSFYILVGPPHGPRFDLGDLATGGGRDRIIDPLGETAEPAFEPLD